MCLLLGAVTTVGVAWGAALVRAGRVGPGALEITIDQGQWPFPAPPHWPPPEGVGGYRMFGHTYIHASGGLTAALQTRRAELYCCQTGHQYGWPARSLYWYSDRGDGAVVSFGKYGIPGRGPAWNPLAAPGVLPSESRLPVLPLLPGFLVDTLFYAVPSWALLATPGLINRWLVGGRRKRRGACVACGYDLRGLAAGQGGAGVVCPECGREVVAKTPGGRRTMLNRRYRLSMPPGPHAALALLV